MGQYFVVHLSGLSTPAEEWLSEHAFSWGALGIAEKIPFEQPEGEEDVFTKIPEHRAVEVYFAGPPESGFLEGVRSRFPEVRAELQTEQDRDWLAEWKKGFQPFALAGAHWVVPSWCEPPPSAQHKIWIDPGMAFGTGTHETTRLAAECLLRVTGSADSLLDVGTGTGILAILARQLGVRNITATEIDPEARRVALENFALNDCRDIRLDERQIEDLPVEEIFDIVTANIIDGVLVRMQDALKARVGPGGWLVVSGIIEERERDFLEGFRLPKAWDLKLEDGDWRLFAVKL